MECYYHPGVNAVGTCKACDKGLCKDCFKDTGKGGACKDRCEEKVLLISELIEFNVHNLERTKSKVLKQSSKKYLWFFFAFIILSIAIFQLLQKNSIGFPGLIVGVIFALIGFLLHVREAEIRALFNKNELNR